YAQGAPDDRDADYAIGHILLERNDPGGLVHLERAMEQFSLALPACELAYDYWLRAGERDRADLWRRRGEGFIDVADRANAERESLSPGDTFLPSDLPAEEHRRLSESLAQVDGVKHAWVAKKQVSHLKEHPLYVIAIAPRGLLASGDRLIEALAQQVETREATYFVATAGGSQAIGKKVAKAGTRLF
ncbi:MAG TPA: hypothetical protein VFU53_13340, partial [Burkholderiales bacterium]|nr:hypothetical protein [Burkholderiales bacterium]